MRIGIVSRFDLPSAIKLTESALGWLSDTDVVLAPEIADKLGKKGVPISKMKAKAIVAIGGDGTVLYAQHHSSDTPILGINMGGRGFLADVRSEDAEKALKSLARGKLKTEERAKLATKLSGESLPDALNEAVVRATGTNTLTFDILIGGGVVKSLRGDGVIVSTPTGSTAYNMSAGGPVLDPRLEAFIVTPLNAHPRTTPIVVPMSSAIEIKLLRPERDAQITIDGHFTKDAKSKDKILFSRSKNPAKFFKWGDEFYQKVKEKL